VGTSWTEHLTIGRLSLIVTAAIALTSGSASAPGISTAGASPSPRSARTSVSDPSVASATRRALPDRADWEKIKAAAQFRRIGLAPHRTAHFRAYAGSLGLSELETIQPLGPGRCREALTYLYGNLLDLQDAQPGENWTPLRRLVAREPSIRACAPR
jgi:hypothetical protein